MHCPGDQKGEMHIIQSNQLADQAAKAGSKGRWFSSHERVTTDQLVKIPGGVSRKGVGIHSGPHHTRGEMCACGTVLTPEALLYTVPHPTVTAPTPGEMPQRIYKFLMEPNLWKTIQQAPQTCMIHAKNKDCCQTSPGGDPTQEPGSPRLTSRLR